MDVQGATEQGKSQAIQDKMENVQKEAEDKKETNQIKAFEQLLQNL